MLTMIVAVDLNGGIGLAGRLPWHIPEDLDHFRRTTYGEPIIMGRKTYQSLGKPLPGRQNIVVSRQATWSEPGIEVAHSLDAALALTKERRAFLIGGANLFAQAMPYADRLIVSVINKAFVCDTFFPRIDHDLWEEHSTAEHTSASANLDFVVVTYERRRHDQEHGTLEAKTSSSDFDGFGVIL